MDDEAFLLLMQLMFGNHEQRQKANFRLSRKGVPLKLRLEARHKGTDARQSLEGALREVIWKEEFRQRINRPYTAQPYSTRTDQAWGHFQEPNKPGPPSMDPNAPMRMQGTISQYEPNFFGKLKEDINSSSLPVRLFGNVLYDFVDDAYVSFLSFQRGNMRTNMAGEAVTGSRIMDAGIKTMINLLPYSKLLRLKGLNAAEFSQTFKGTFINRLKPATRGLINRAYNMVYTKRRSRFAKGVYSTSTAVSKSLEAEND